jgi:hypothetical protein
MNTITNTLRAVEIGQPQQFRNLTAFPLLQREKTSPAYITLAEAMNKGTAEITEISEGGSVPELLLSNTGDDKLLVLDGEELLGAKQNRIANLTVLADANSKTVLPVSCVEQGRWNYQSRDFKAASRTMFHRARAAKASAVSENLKATGTHGANQGEVWNQIAAKQMRMNVESSTAAMADVFDDFAQPVEDYTRNFTTIEGQVGVLFAIDGEAEGLDMFDAPETMQRMLPNLIRSFAIDAIESADGRNIAAERDTAVQFLDRIAVAQADTYDGVGLGTDVRLTAPLVAGGGLIYEDKLIHLAAFKKAASSSGGDRESYRTRLHSGRYDRMRRRNGDS